MTKNINTQWEYCSLSIQATTSSNARDEKLNAMGNDGWEMTGTDGGTFYFKRQKQKMINEGFTPLSERIPQHSAEERDVVTAHSLDRASQAAHSSQRA